MPEQLRNPESPLNKVVIEHIQPTDEDERRAIVEFQNNQELPFRNMKVIRINKSEDPDGFRLGNHYHEDVELFFLEEGKIDTLVLEDSNTGERKIYKGIEASTRIFLPPNVAHLLIFKNAAKLLAFSENQFNPANLVPHKIEY